LNNPFINTSKKARSYDDRQKQNRSWWEMMPMTYSNWTNKNRIPATDGDFNQGDENVNKLAKKYKKCGLSVSVIGIKTKPEPEENMRTLAKNGGGNYIAIDSYDRALTSLVNEIKINSFKGLKK